MTKGITPSNSLGEILLRTANIPRERIDEALGLQASGAEAGRLGEILVRRGVVTEEQVLRALADQFGLEFRARLSLEEMEKGLVRTAKFPFAYAKANRILPLKRQLDGSLLTAVVDPTLTSALDQTRITFGAPLAPVVVPLEALLTAMHAAYDSVVSAAEIEESFKVAHAGSTTEFDGEVPEPGRGEPDEAPIIRLANTLIIGAIKSRASDIHIEPYERTMIVRYRIDGVLKQIVEPPRSVQSALIARIKILGGLNIAEKRLPQDGRIRFSHAGKEIDIRVSTAPTVYGERIVLRLLDRSATLLDLKDIGFDETQLQVMQNLIDRPHGIVLVTGPTGSGKTTTLYSALSRLNKPDLNILTIENPVEYQIHGISQMPVNPKIDLTFASGLRCFLRQDPDVIMVGEIRDRETAEIAIQAALTGHLVLSTVHTNDAPSSISRLVDMGVEPFLVASALSAVIAQRLVRKVCVHCRVPVDVTEDELRQAQVPQERLPLYRNGRFYQAGANGCSECAGTGYKGRTGIYEMMLVDDEIRSLIVSHADSNTIKKAAIRSQQMVLLREDGVKRAAQGVTTLHEIMRTTEEQI